jgi:hypothetical protein
MKKINVRSPYYIVADNLNAPIDDSPPTHSYYILNFITHHYGYTLSNSTLANAKEHLCEICEYTWKDTNDDCGYKMTGDNTDECPYPVTTTEGEKCLECVTESTYKVNRFPPQVGDTIFSNADTPVAQTSLNGFFPSNTVEGYDVYLQGKDPSVCRKGDDGLYKFQYRRIYQIASGVISAIHTIEPNCVVQVVDNTDSKQVSCGITYGVGPFVGKKEWVLNMTQVTTTDNPLAIEITNGGDVPIRFKAKWTQGTEVDSKFKGHSSYQTQLTNAPYSYSAVTDLALASPSSKATYTLNLTDKVRSSPDGVIITAETAGSIENDFFNIKFNCPDDSKFDAGGTDDPLNFDSDTYVNLITGNYSGFYTGSAGNLWNTVFDASGNGYLRAHLESIYGSGTAYEAKVKIFNHSTITDLEGCYSTGICSFDYKFLKDISSFHANISNFAPDQTTTAKVINIVFVMSSSKYWQTGVNNPSGDFVKDFNNVKTIYESFPFGKMNTYIVIVRPTEDNQTDNSYMSLALPNFLTTIKKGRYSCGGGLNSEFIFNNNYYFDTIKYGNQENIESAKKRIKTTRLLNANVAETCTGSPTNSPNILGGVGLNTTKTKLTQRIIDCIKDLGFTKGGDGTTITGGTP